MNLVVLTVVWTQAGGCTLAKKTTIKMGVK